MTKLAKFRSLDELSEVYFETSEFITGRGLRTPQHTYAVAAPKMPGWRAVPRAEKYIEHLLYDNFADPFQHVNRAGRAESNAITESLRNRMLGHNQEAGDPAPAIEPSWFPYP